MARSWVVMNLQGMYLRDYGLLKEHPVHAVAYSSLQITPLLDARDMMSTFSGQ